jgi:UDP-glucose 4-epimerase
MRKKKIKELVFASSSSVYGEPDQIPVDENAPIRPVSIYGASKVACENLIYAYTQLYSLKAVILRYANVVGPRLRHGVIYDLLMKLKHNKTELEVLGDGKQVRSYIYIDDAIAATMLAYENSKKIYDVFNVASEDWVTVDDVANIILQELGLNNIKIVHKPVLHGVGWPGDVKKIALKIDKLRRLGFKPKLKSEEAVKVTVRTLAKELL